MTTDIEAPPTEPPARRAPNVAKASFFMVGALFLSRLLGILRDTAMSTKFGIGHNTDAYRLAFAVPDTIFYLIAGGALSSAFIPVFSELLHTDRESEAWDLFSVVVTAMSLILVVLISAAWIASPELSAYFAAGKDPHLFPLIVRMSRIVLPAQFAFFIGGLMFGVLYAKNLFTAPGLAPNIYNVGIIVGALVFSAFVTPGIVGMSWGALAGAFVGNILIPLWALRRIGGRFRPSLNLRAPGVKKVFTLMLPVILGLSLPAVFGIIMQKFASQYPEGINTAVDLSNKLMQAPLGIFGQSLALAVFPALSQFYAQQRMDLFRAQLANSMRTTLYLAVPASAMLGALAPQIVRLFYAYGKTTAASLPPIYHCLQLFSIGVFAWCMHPMLMRAFYAMHRTVKPIVVGTLATVVFIALYFAFRPKLGYLAMPLAGSLSAIALVSVLGAAVYRDVEGFDVGGVLGTLFRSALAAAVAAAYAWGAFHVLPHQAGRLVSAALFLFVVCSGGWIYFFLTTRMGMPETAYVSRALGRFGKRPITPVEADNG